MEVFDDGSGPALFVGAYNPLGPGGIAKWNGKAWSALGSGVNDDVGALAVFDDGSGPALYVGGAFTTAGGVPASNIARWNGTSWSALGSGTSHSVDALAVFDDGTGPGLYAGGNFNAAGGHQAFGIAKWDGIAWSALPGMTDTGFVISCLQVFDDGSGPALFAGGPYVVDLGGGLILDHVAKWDGSTWSAVGTEWSNHVYSLAVYDDGGGPALYCGGWWSFSFGQTSIRKWNGTNWLPVGSGVNFHVLELEVFDDGSGPALFAGGLFTAAGSVPANGIARWDGVGWTSLQGGVAGGGVNALGVFDDGSTPALFVAGSFTSTPGADGGLAKWGWSAVESLPGCSGNPGKLLSLTPCAPLGSSVDLRIKGLQALSGFTLCYFGGSGADAAGCGIFLPGFGELLLGLTPSPSLVATGPLAAGAHDFSLQVPTMPSLIGATAHLQGAAIDASLASPVEVTNALAIELGP